MVCLYRFINSIDYRHYSTYITWHSTILTYLNAWRRKSLAYLVSLHWPSFRICSRRRLLTLWCTVGSPIGPGDWWVATDDSTGGDLWWLCFSEKNTILSYSPYLICSWIAVQDWDSERQDLQNPSTKISIVITSGHHQWCIPHGRHNKSHPKNRCIQWGSLMMACSEGILWKDSLQLLQEMSFQQLLAALAPLGFSAWEKWGLESKTRVDTIRRLSLSLRQTQGCFPSTPIKNKPFLRNCESSRWLGSSLEVFARPVQLQCLDQQL